MVRRKVHLPLLDGFSKSDVNAAEAIWATATQEHLLSPLVEANAVLTSTIRKRLLSTGQPGARKGFSSAKRRLRAIVSCLLRLTLWLIERGTPPPDWVQPLYPASAAPCS